MSINLRSDLLITLVDHAGDDMRLARRGKVLPPHVADSTLDAERRLRYMMRKRHGTPFEASYLEFYVEAPVACFWQWARHRVGWSYNVFSGRYDEYPPDFYQCPRHRPMIEPDDHKAHSPEYAIAGDIEYSKYLAHTIASYNHAWHNYQRMREAGIACEVARNVLGFGVYIRFYASCNMRSFLHWLELRTHDARAERISFPQWEINQLALHAEAQVSLKFPLTLQTFNEARRMAP